MDNLLVLTLSNNETTKLKYELVNNQIKIWWSDSDFSVFEKSKFNNSLDDYLSDIGEIINLPKIENFWVISQPELCIDITMVNDKVFVNKKQCSYSKLEEQILAEKSKINQLNANFISIRLYADKNMSMKYIHDLSQILRKINLLKVILMGEVDDNSISKLQTNYIGMAKKLPPLNAPDTDVKDLAKDSITFFEIDATDSEITPEILKPKFRELISSSKKYVAGIFYDNSTIYNRYMGFHNMTRTVIYEFRNNYAIKEYNLNYGELSTIQQNKIKDTFPIIVPEKYTEND